MSNQESTRVPEPNIVKLRSLLDGARIAMLTTLDGEDNLCSRPMALQELDATGCLWFFIGRHTHVVNDLNRNNRVNVSVAHGNTYVSLCGRGVVVEDPKKAATLWNPLYKAWFPMGLEDPDLTLLQVTVDRAEYWDTPGGMVTTLAGYVKSLTTGEAARGGEHGEIGIRHDPA